MIPVFTGRGGSPVYRRCYHGPMFTGVQKLMPVFTGRVLAEANIYYSNAHSWSERKLFSEFLCTVAGGDNSTVHKH